MNLFYVYICLFKRWREVIIFWHSKHARVFCNFFHDWKNVLINVKVLWQMKRRDRNIEDQQTNQETTTLFLASFDQAILTCNEDQMYPKSWWSK